MQFTIEVGRYNPEGLYADTAVPGKPFPAPWDRSPARRYQTYTVELPEHAVVLDALIAIREYQDQSVAVRCACRSAICGSCAMWINGHAQSGLQEQTRGVHQRRQDARRVAALDADHSRFGLRHDAVLG